MVCGALLLTWVKLTYLARYEGQVVERRIAERLQIGVEKIKIEEESKKKKNRQKEREEKNRKKERKRERKKKKERKKEKKLKSISFGQNRYRDMCTRGNKRNNRVPERKNSKMPSFMHWLIPDAKKTSNGLYGHHGSN